MQAYFYSLHPLLDFLVHVIVFYKVDCVAFKLTSKKLRQTFASLQAYWHVLLKGWSKQLPCQGVASPKWAHMTIELRAHARVDKLPLLSFTYVINFSHTLLEILGFTIVICN
jgi:hypothetical protein